jgi:hypothetical protein
MKVYLATKKEKMISENLESAPKVEEEIADSKTELSQSTVISSFFITHFLFNLLTE